MIAVLRSSAALLVAVCACTGRGSAPGIEPRVALTPFATCEDLERTIEDAAVREMRAWLDPETVERLRALGLPLAAPSEVLGDGTRFDLPDAGVEAGELVKVDADRLYVLAGPILYLVARLPLSVQASLRIEGFPRALLLEETPRRISVLSTVRNDFEPGARPLPWFCAERACPEYGSTKLTVVDVSEPTQPAVVAERYLPGRYASARRDGEFLRVVLIDEPRWPAAVRWWPDSDERPIGDAELRELMDENEVHIRARRLDEWLPPGASRVSGGERERDGHRCAEFLSPNAPVELGLTTVATIELADPGAEPKRTIVLARPQVVYASAGSLYVAAQHWWWWPSEGQRDWSYLFRLDLGDPQHARAVAAGGVGGHLLDPFAADEHEGHLRALTRDRRDGDAPSVLPRSLHRLAVLDLELREVGAIPDVQPGDGLTDARFVGPRAFARSHASSEPALSVLDLADPTAPREAGTVSIPGAMSIAPFGPGHVLALHLRSGVTDAAVELSLIEVADAERPRLVHTASVGAVGDHNFSSRQRLGIPISTRGIVAVPFGDAPWTDDFWGSFVSQLRVYEVDTTRGPRSLGALDLADMHRRFSRDGASSDYSPWIHSALLVDEELYAISELGVRVGRVGARAQPLGTVFFEDPRAAR